MIFFSNMPERFEKDFNPFFRLEERTRQSQFDPFCGLEERLRERVRELARTAQQAAADREP